MARSIFSIAFMVLLGFAVSAVKAQFLIPPQPVFAPYAFGAYGGFAPYSGYWGYGPYGAFGGYGPWNYSQQLFQQQAALTQQVFQQRQQAILSQIQTAQAQVKNLDGIKQQLFQKYVNMSDSDKSAVRSGLMTDYLKLDAHTREGWKRDGAIQAILGMDLQRLDAAALVGQMNESDKNRYQEAMLKKYRSLPVSEQRAWREDPIVGIILGKDWWLK